MTLMHEWVLISITYEWQSARVEISFDTYDSGIVSVIADGVVDLHVPQLKPWGPSIHVNEVREPRARIGKPRKLEIEMQSGDVITVVAASFVLPQPHRATAPLETSAHRG